MPRGGVQRGKQLVGRVGTRLDQRVEQRGLAGIGVTDQRNIEGVAPFALTPLRGTLALDLVQALARALDGLGNHAPVQLDLGFAGATAHADATTLPLQVRPAAHQARLQVLQTRELDLQFALMAARALRENVQDQQRAVIDRHAQVPFQVALLRRAQRLVEQDFGRPCALGQHRDFIGLARAHEQGRVGRLALAGQAGSDGITGGLRQLAQLFEFAIEVRQAEIDPDKDDRGRGGRGGGGLAQQGVIRPRSPGRCAARERAR